MMLKIATLNIRRIQGNKTSIKIEKLLLLQKTHHFDILFLQETHLTNIEYPTYITKKLEREMVLVIWHISFKRGGNIYKWQS